VPGGLLERLGRSPDDIERRSRAIAAQAVAGRWAGGDDALAAACVYAAGDLTLADRLSIAGRPAAAGVDALRGGRGVLVDVAMVRAGTAPGPSVGVAIEMGVAGAGVTRAADGMARGWERWGAGGVVVVGNAPTALLAALDLAATRGAPACVIATCPGFTLAAEAKAALVASGLPHLTVVGSAGASGLAVAALNALIELAR
jgi:precorrin-8X/cobalt-precorrin-8 methylmutase